MSILIERFPPQYSRKEAVVEAKCQAVPSFDCLILSPKCWQILIFCVASLGIERNVTQSRWFIEKDSGPAVLWSFVQSLGKNGFLVDGSS